MIGAPRDQKDQQEFREDLGEIAKALEVFIGDPTDETAHDLSLATMVPNAKAFFTASDTRALFPVDDLLHRMETAQGALNGTPPHKRTDLIAYHALTVEWRLKLLLARYKGGWGAMRDLFKYSPSILKDRDGEDADERAA